MIRNDRAAPQAMRGKRIAIVSSVHRWNDTRIFIRQAASLAKEGYDVVLAAIGDQIAPFQCSGVRIYPLARRRRPLRWITWLSILRLILAERPAVVHAHDPELFPLLLLLKLTGRKVVCDVHEDIGEQVLHKEWIPRCIRRPLSSMLKVGQRWLPQLADVVILAEDSYLRSFPSAPNVCVIRNFPVLPLECKQHYPADVLRMIYVGDVRMVRGIGEYVAITDRLARTGVPVELRIVGSFADPEEERQIDCIVSRLHLEKHVIFIGRRPPEEIPAILAECDVGLALLHPIGNYRESYPTKMFEYMAAGVPVVASSFALWEDVIVGNDCGRVVDPLNVEEAAAAILDYWNSEALRERHGRNGRLAVMRRYHWGLELPQLSAIYSTLTRAVPISTVDA